MKHTLSWLIKSLLLIFSGSCGTAEGHPEVETQPLSETGVSQQTGTGFVTRPHIEFIELKDLVFFPLLNNGSPTGIRVKQLSEDKATGAMSLFAVMPPQWVRLASGYYESALEIFVLEGDLRIGEDHLTPGSYSYLPAGACQGPVFSDAGCRLLMLFEETPVFVESDTGKPDAKEGLRIRHLNTNKMPWELPPSFEGRSLEETPPGVFVKWLRINPETTAYTVLTKCQAGWRESRLESHETWEELFLIEGDFLMGTFGMMTGGGYIFRPEHIPHGPQATKTGALWFCRGKKKVDFTFEQVPWADEMIERYMAASHLFQSWQDTGER